MNRFKVKCHSSAGKQGVMQNFNATICSCHKDSENKGIGWRDEGKTVGKSWAGRQWRTGRGKLQLEAGIAKRKQNLPATCWLLWMKMKF